MEQLNITTTKDNDKVYKILGDLLSTNKEFQIMITVPAGMGEELPKEVERRSRRRLRLSGIWNRT